MDSDSLPSTSGSLDGRSWVMLLFTVYRAGSLKQLARRVRLELAVQVPMLRQRWKILFFGISMQYVHGIFTQLAHRMHQPLEEPLHDIGFILTPELGPEQHWVSEALFATLFLMFFGWSFTPFVTHRRKRFYTVVLWSRLLMVLVACQLLRIASFSMTQLPGSSFHCRAGEATAVRPWPEHWSGHLVFDFNRQVTKSCGDLIFSSHTIFTLSGILMYNEYGTSSLMKLIAWVCGAILSVLIIASRKHYTVDILIAWYTVPLVFYALQRRWTTVRPLELLSVLGENGEPDRAPPMDGGAERDIEACVVGKVADGKRPPSPSAKERKQLAELQLQGSGVQRVTAEGGGFSNLLIGMVSVGSGSSKATMIRPRSAISMQQATLDLSGMEEAVQGGFAVRSAGCFVS